MGVDGSDRKLGFITSGCTPGISQDPLALKQINIWLLDAIV